MFHNVMNLKELRIKKGLSLRDLSSITGISNSHLSQLENNKADISAKAFRTLKEVFPKLKFEQFGKRK